MPNVLIARALGLSSPLRLLFFNSHPIFFLLVFLLSTLAFLCFFQKLAVHLHHLYHHSFRPDSLSLASASEYFSYFGSLYIPVYIWTTSRGCRNLHKICIRTAIYLARIKILPWDSGGRESAAHINGIPEKKQEQRPTYTLTQLHKLFESTCKAPLR